MQFYTPAVIYEMPVYDDYRKRYTGFLVRIAYQTAVKVYWRTRLSEAQNHRCCWCGMHMTELQGREHSATIEHVVPISVGGKDDPENYAVACNKCNRRRGNTPADEFLKQPACNKVRVNYTELRQYGLNVSGNTRPCKVARSVEKMAVIKAIAEGKGNPFEFESRAWKFFERYSNSPNFALPAKSA